VANNSHRATRTARARSRKFSGHCDACGAPLCSCRAYQYTDESNGAITASAPYLCRACYEKRYGVKIPTEVDAYKARLLGALGRYADQVADPSARDFAFRVMRLIEHTD
jgi:hypothetical protein